MTSKLAVASQPLIPSVSHPKPAVSTTTTTAAMSGTAPAEKAPAEGEKLFTCLTCRRVFNKKANLKVHSRKHTGEKPYVCQKPGCGRSFMWKSSVTFHEQHCQTAKKDSISSPSLSSTSTPSRGGVQKRPKGGGGSVTGGSSSSSVRSSPASSAAVACATLKGEMSQISPSTSKDKSQKPSYAPVSAMSKSSDNISGSGGFSSQVDGSGAVLKSTAPMSSTSSDAPVGAATGVSAGSSPMWSPGSTSNTFPLPASAPSSSSTGSPASLVSPPPPATAFAPSTPGRPDSAHLPAPSTLLADKRVQQGVARPPVLPGSLQKHLISLQQSHKDTFASGAKPMFDLRVPSAPTGASGAKPPVMFSGTKMPNKMPKIPIAMDLDDSDDEGETKIVGAQETFIRTGNFFCGFAPPPRCSPLPLSSPIVCGVSPMPLSPLGPFSPLPPDSPAHNAPDPIHPPVNPSFTRSSSNTNWEH